MKLKCPKCKSECFNVSKPLIKKMSFFKILIISAIFFSIWNLAASIADQYRYTCTNCGKRFK